MAPAQQLCNKICKEREELNPGWPQLGPTTSLTVIYKVNLLGTQSQPTQLASVKTIDLQASTHQQGGHIFLPSQRLTRKACPSDGIKGNKLHTVPSATVSQPGEATQSPTYCAHPSIEPDTGSTCHVPATVSLAGMSQLYGGSVGGRAGPDGGRP